MFPNKLFPFRPLPKRAFPESFGLSGTISTYAQILLSIQETLQGAIQYYGIYPDQLFPLNPYPTQLYPKGAPKFGSSLVPITLHPEPFPTLAGPIAFLMPGSSLAISPQKMGAGRFFDGFNSYVTIRVVDRSILDFSGSDVARLTDISAGLMRSAHFIMDVLEFAFPLDSEGMNLTQEPLILEDYEVPSTYHRAGEWGILDLVFKFPYTHAIVNPLPDNPLLTGDRPVPTNMADLLLSVKSQIINQGYLKDHTTVITIGNDIFPLAGGPFATIKPGRFHCVDVDKYGAGRDYATMEGEFVVSPVVRNILDKSGESQQILTSEDPSISLYSLSQYLTEQLELCFLADTHGNFIAENPLALKKIGKPRYYKGDSSFASVDLTFIVRYQEDLT